VKQTIVLFFTILMLFGFSVTTTEAQEVEPCFYLSSTELVVGDVHDDVATVKDLLTKLQFYTEENTDTAFTESLATSLKSIQFVLSVPETGALDKDTIQALNELCEGTRELPEYLSALPELQPTEREIIIEEKAQTGEKDKEEIDISLLKPLPSEKLLETDGPITKKLSKWDWNNEVKILQEFLLQQGLYKGRISGIYLGKTTDGVKAFQELFQIQPLGYIDEKTRSLINQMINAS
jgi:hypothetical protein